MLGKIRPVGSRVPAMDDSAAPPYAWEPGYQTVFMASGTAALSAAVAIARSRKPHIDQPEILMPAYGCPDLVAAVIAQGGTPVLVDLEPGLPWMDRDQFRQQVNANTVAAVGVGFLGISERLSALSLICHDNDLLLIEDSAQCFPPVCATQPFADCAVLSFGRGKPINLMGGGALLVKSDLAGQPLDVVGACPSSRMDTGVLWRLQRMIFNLLMMRVPFYILEKIPFLNIGETHFKPLDSVSRLDLPRPLLGAGIRAFCRRPSTQELYSQQLAFAETMGWSLLGRRAGGEGMPILRYGLLAPTEGVRNRVARALNRRGIGASTFYHRSLPHIEGLESVFAGVECPHADGFAARLVTLPCHEDVTSADVALIAQIIRDQGSDHPVA